MAINEKMKFKIGDKVRILPSATCIGVSESEVGTTQTIIRVVNSVTITITDTDGGEWHVDPNDIAPAIKVGQQLLFSFMMP